jgi:cobalt/nickel transport protein
VRARRGRPVTVLMLVGLGLALFIGVVVANYAASTPDALERSVIDSACKDAPDEEACLAEKEGEPVWTNVPAALDGYANVSLSGLVGVVVTFAVGAGLVWVLRRTRPDGGGERDEPEATA